jgi:hypothetical protein
MSKHLKILGLALLLLAAIGGCKGEKAVEPLSDYESADVQAKAFNFQIYPGARFVEDQTETLRKAHFAMNPGATEAPPMAVYETGATLEEVAQFYAGKYGYTIAENAANDFKTVKPEAYYTTGEFALDAESVKPVAEKLGLKTDFSKASGSYRGAYFSPQITLPRVTLQRPYFNVLTGQIVDKTLVVMVRE